MREIKRRHLALYNGQDRKEIYIGYKGKIYEVTESRHWAKGLHYEHWAGQDLTEELGDAPHGEEFVLKFPCVGRLVD